MRDSITMSNPLAQNNSRDQAKTVSIRLIMDPQEIKAGLLKEGLILRGLNDMPGLEVTISDSIDFPSCKIVMLIGGLDSVTRAISIIVSRMFEMVKKNSNFIVSFLRLKFLARMSIIEKTKINRDVFVQVFPGLLCHSTDELFIIHGNRSAIKQFIRNLCSTLLETSSRVHSATTSTLESKSNDLSSPELVLNALNSMKAGIAQVLAVAVINPMQKSNPTKTDQDVWTKEIRVPNKCVDKVIGKDECVIQKIREVSGALITIVDDAAARQDINGVERSITIQGNLHSILVAKYLIELTVDLLKCENIVESDPSEFENALKSNHSEEFVAPSHNALLFSQTVLNMLSSVPDPNTRGTLSRAKLSGMNGGKRKRGWRNGRNLTENEIEEVKKVEIDAIKMKMEPTNVKTEVNYIGMGTKKIKIEPNS